LLTVTIPLFLFILLSMLISGIKVEQGVQLDLSASERTIFELLKILIVSMFGLSLAAVTSQLVMKHAIEHSLRGLSKFRLPVEAIALGCSLMLRFITLFLHEYRRFGKIVKARAKDRSKRNGIRFRHLPALFIPMIISLLQTASDLTTAMEARGMKSLKMRRTSGIRLQMVRRDWMVVLSGLLVFMMLAGMRYLL
jgi:energy-coupling factor transport system ATP-binding protein